MLLLYIIIIIRWFQIRNECSRYEIPVWKRSIEITLLIWYLTYTGEFDTLRPCTFYHGFVFTYIEVVVGRCEFRGALYIIRARCSIMYSNLCIGLPHGTRKLYILLRSHFVSTIVLWSEDLLYNWKPAENFNILDVTSYSKIIEWR